MDTPLDQHARIATVRIEGASNTRRSFLASLVHPHLLDSAPTFDSVLRTTRHIGHYLVQTDIFKSVNARIQPAEKPGDVDVIFTAPERSRFFLKTSTEIGNSEGTAVCIHRPCPKSPLNALFSKSATSRIRNVFGGAETFEANISFGTKTRRSFHAAFTAPITHTLDTHAELSVFALDRDNSSYMSATETLRGARAVIRVRRVRVSPHRLTREYAPASEVPLPPAQDNTNSATRRLSAASEISCQPRHSGSPCLLLGTTR